MTQQEYIDYFEELARSSNHIKHTDATPRFYVVKNNDYSVIMRNTRTLKLPCILIDQYYDTPSRTNDKFMTTITGGVTVLVALRKGDENDIYRAEQEAAQIALKFVNRMYFDCRDPRGKLYSKRMVPSTEYEGEPFPTMTDVAAGWGYPFELEIPASFAVDAGDWSDL
jgi:hypothetical protein